MTVATIARNLLFTSLIFGTGFCATANAEQPEKSPLERLEAMVVLNETGIVSITYDEPWFWEISDYAATLWQAMTISLNVADVECRNLTQAMTDNPDQRLDDSARHTFDSLIENGRIRDIRLISSILKKFTAKNGIDAETSSDRGKYWQLGDGACSNMDIDDPGYIQQMFMRPENATEAYYQGMCERITKSVACLNGLNEIDNENRRRQGKDEYTGLKFSSDVFSVVSGERDEVRVGKTTTDD